MLHRWARLGLAVYWPVLALGTHWPKLGHGKVGFADSGGDKPVHFACFVVLTLLMIFARLAGRSAGFVRSLTTGLVIAAVYAIVDEVTQGWLDREVSSMDIVANLVGVVATGVFVWLGRSGWKDPAGAAAKLAPPTVGR